MRDALRGRPWQRTRCNGGLHSRTGHFARVLHFGTAFANGLLDGIEKLVDAERLVENRFETALTSFHDRMSRIVTKAGHQNHGQLWL